MYFPCPHISYRAVLEAAEPIVLFATSIYLRNYYTAWQAAALKLPSRLLSLSLPITKNTLPTPCSKAVRLLPHKRLIRHVLSFFGVPIPNVRQKLLQCTL